MGLLLLADAIAIVYDFLPILRGPSLAGPHCVYRKKTRAGLPIFLGNPALIGIFSLFQDIL
jgi:hypothetical protein